jgi:hypothetical protein
VVEKLAGDAIGGGDGTVHGCVVSGVLGGLPGEKEFAS